MINHWQFSQALCISFKGEDQAIIHKKVYFCKIPSDIANAESTLPPKFSAWVKKWKQYEGSLTTEPQPWNIDDPKKLATDKKIFPQLREEEVSSLHQFLKSRPELSKRIDIESSKSAGPSSAEFSNRAAALALNYRAVQAASQPGPGHTAAAPRALGDPLPWQGAAASAPLFKVLVDFNYRLSTAVAAVAPRFGAELPALTRILIEHRRLAGSHCFPEGGADFADTGRFALFMCVCVCGGLRAFQRRNVCPFIPDPQAAGVEVAALQISRLHALKLPQSKLPQLLCGHSNASDCEAL
jgi:hypothetical protein